MISTIKGFWKVCRYGDLYMVLAALAAQSINISVGFCQGFSAVLLPQYTHEHPNVTYEQSSWIASLGVISNPVGALLGGMMVDAVGRRLMLQSIVLPNLIGWLVIAFSETYVFLCVGRFITGFTIGMSTVSYIYVAEITTPEKRGVLSALGPGLVSTGIFVVYALGAFVHWRKVAAICAGFSLLTPFLMHFVPESPLWLASKGQMKEAYNALFWLRQNNSAAQQELVDFTKDRRGESMSFAQKLALFKRRRVLKPFALLMMFFAFQEMSGIYVILYYAVDFFKSVGTSVNEFTASIIVGGVRVLMGGVGAALISRFRRRTLATASGLLLGGAMLGAALSHDALLRLVFVLLHVCFSMVGFLQLPWIMCGELFPQDVRGVLSGATSCCAYLLIFLNIKTYPRLQACLGADNTLLLFAVCALLGALYCLLFLPETKGKTLAEIMRQFDSEKAPPDPETAPTPSAATPTPVIPPASSTTPP